ncbi:hypothetical protein RUM43_000632 [Polyplax serrata]|uniref:Uncharacterized protein n=1 Tax=Polyplax serrata TaxID=468196 RepID=A0AAN8XPB8_POLSC
MERVGGRCALPELFSFSVLNVLGLHIDLNHYFVIRNLNERGIHRTWLHDLGAEFIEESIDKSVSFGKYQIIKARTKKEEDIKNIGFGFEDARPAILSSKGSYSAINIEKIGELLSEESVHHTDRFHPLWVSIGWQRRINTLQDVQQQIARVNGSNLFWN